MMSDTKRPNLLASTVSPIVGVAYMGDDDFWVKADGWVLPMQNGTHEVNVEIMAIGRAKEAFEAAPGKNKLELSTGEVLTVVVAK